MSWKTAFQSFYYSGTTPPPVCLHPEKTALLIIDIQACYFEIPDDEIEANRWRPFREALEKRVIPRTQQLLDLFRAHQMDVFWARIACLNSRGRDRSLSQARPGFNDLLLPKDGAASQIAPQFEVLPDEIVICKTTDSALTGTNLRLVLANMKIENVVVCGIFTDQCVSSTVRSLADESFNVVIAHDACAAATEALHDAELTIINNIYGQCLSVEEIEELFRTADFTLR